jgi:hypothetical protein
MTHPGGEEEPAFHFHAHFFAAVPSAGASKLPVGRSLLGRRALQPARAGIRMLFQFHTEE